MTQKFDYAAEYKTARAAAARKEKAEKIEKALNIIRNEYRICFNLINGAKLFKKTYNIR